MSSNAHPSDPFSESDEAFFRAGVQAEREAVSERPVVLDGPVVAEGDDSLSGPSRGPFARDARRARLLRTVTSTLAGLSLLALVGLARYALRPEVEAAPEPAPVALRTAATSAPVEPVPAEAAPVEVAASLISAFEDEPVWDEASACGARLAPETTVPTADELTGPPARETTIPAAPEQPPPRLSKQAPARHSTVPVHRRANTPHVSKAALLRAIRPS